MSTSVISRIKLNGATFPIYTDQPAADVVDQLIYAADEAGWTPTDPQYDGDVSLWAEDTALVFLARTPQGGESHRFDVV
jgi:hypothetical protein